MSKEIKINKKYFHPIICMDLIYWRIPYGYSIPEEGIGSYYSDSIFSFDSIYWTNKLMAYKLIFKHISKVYYICG